MAKNSVKLPVVCGPSPIRKRVQCEVCYGWFSEEAYKNHNKKAIEDAELINHTIQEASRFIGEEVLVTGLSRVSGTLFQRRVKITGINAVLYAEQGFSSTIYSCPNRPLNLFFRTDKTLPFGNYFDFSFKRNALPLHEVTGEYSYYVLPERVFKRCAAMESDRKLQAWIKKNCKKED